MAKKELNKRDKLNEKIREYEALLKKAREDLTTEVKREKNDWLKQATAMISLFYPEDVERMKNVLTHNLTRDLETHTLTDSEKSVLSEPDNQPSNEHDARESEGSGEHVETVEQADANNGETETHQAQNRSLFGRFMGSENKNEANEG